MLQKLTPSPYQTCILNAVSKNLILPIKSGIGVIALAGTGKSTLITLIAETIQKQGLQPEEMVILVFGTKNKDDLRKCIQAKLGAKWGRTVRTIHSLAYSIYREALNVSTANVNPYKYETIASKLGWITGNVGGLGRLVANSDYPAILNEKAFIKLLELLRLYAYQPNPENIQTLNQTYNLSVTDLYRVAQAAKDCLDRGEEEALFRNKIDTTDMVWMPWKCQDIPFFKGAIARLKNRLKVILIDEAQDVDNLQLSLLQLLITPSQSFLIAVGDPNQSVYHFRGCLSDGLAKIMSRFNCQVFESPLNYRCGQLHLQLVRDIFPHIPIQAHPNAPQGEIRIISSADLLKCFTDSTLTYLIVSRKNSTLIQSAIRIIATGKTATIKDEKAGDYLFKEIKRIAEKPYNPLTFEHKLDVYAAKTRHFLEQSPDAPTRLAEFADFIESIRTLYDTYKPTTLQKWQTTINQIFNSRKSTSIHLLSIHSAKGAEAEVVFLLYPEEIPFTHSQQSLEELQQEWNTLYIALTRIKANRNPGSGILYLVLKERDCTIYPDWLPQAYRQLYNFGKPVNSI